MVKTGSLNRQRERERKKKIICRLLAKKLRRLQAAITTILQLLFILQRTKTLKSGITTRDVYLTVSRLWAVLVYQKFSVYSVSKGPGVA